MMPLRRNQIEERAKAMLQKHDCYRLPIEVEALIESLGITFETRLLENEFSGFFVHRKNKPVIVVNTKHPKVRQRFTISHEIGHYALHRKRDKESVFVDSLYFRRDNTTQSADRRKEREANVFAAELLMPKELIHKYINDRGLDLSQRSSVTDMSEEFEVSKQAMEYRLKDLGFIQIDLLT